MRWLITGGAGFIGSWLAEYIVLNNQSDDTVMILDDLSTGSIANIRHLRPRPDIEVYIGSIFDQDKLAALVDDADIVVHLAAAVGVKLVVESPIRTIHTNVDGTSAVLKACAKKGKRVLIASTSEVYGLSPTFPLREDQPLTLGAPTRGRWSYAASKLLDEYLALAYYAEKTLPVTIVRLFNTVGPRQTGRYGMVIPTFARQALSGKPITVFGSGKQTRCFCHVIDVIAALYRVCLAENTVGEILNIGSTEEISIYELALRVSHIAAASSQIQMVPYEQAYAPGFEDMPRRIPDVSKIRQLKVWNGHTQSLNTIIQNVVVYQRTQHL